MRPISRVPHIDKLINRLSVPSLEALARWVRNWDLMNKSSAEIEHNEYMKLHK